MDEKKEIAMVPTQLANIVAIWLRSALDCPTFRWDGDQYDAAMEALKEFQALLSSAPQPSPRADTGKPASGRRELVERLLYAANNPTLSNGSACFMDVSTAKEAAAALSEAGERWIPVTTRLPNKEESTNLLLTTDVHDNRSTGFYDSESGFTHFEFWPVVAWMVCPHYAAPATQESER